MFTNRYKMLSALFALVYLGVLLSGCNSQPVPKNAVTYDAVPLEIAKVIGHWKMGPFTIGCRIVTDQYVFISDVGALRGQDGQAFQGPGLVPHATVTSFENILPLAEEARRSNVSMRFYGDLVRLKDGSIFEWNGKKVVLLHTAAYADTVYEVNRRPWDN